MEDTTTTTTTTTETSKKRRGANRSGWIKKYGDKYRGSISLGRDPKTGKLIRKWVTRKTMREVSAELNKLNARAVKGRPVAAAEQTLGAYMTGWLEDVKRTKASGTIRSYEQTARLYVIPELGHFKLEALTGQHVQKFLNALADSGLSPASVKNCNATLKTALTSAIRHGLIDRNAAKNATPPKQRKYEAKHLTLEDAKKLFAAMAGHRWEALIVVATMMGLRRGEVAGLQWSDIDFADDYSSARMSIRNSMQRVPRAGQSLQDVKSKTSRRNPPVPKMCIDALLRRQAIQQQEKLDAGKKWTGNPEGFIFTSRYGAPIVLEELSRELDAGLERAGLPHIRFHDLRHSAASLLISMGVPLKIIQEILGHSNFQITADLYTHLLPTQLEDAMRKMDAAFTQAKPVRPERIVARNKVRLVQ
jgi:integrase